MSAGKLNLICFLFVCFLFFTFNTWKHNFTEISPKFTDWYFNGQTQQITEDEERSRGISYFQFWNI